MAMDFDYCRNYDSQVEAAETGTLRRV